jgi:2-polyprenyl-3-methyl-5-hydroxy-6-metoxy-1,4-benzoquinol methylase
MELEKIAQKYDPSSPEKDFDYWLIQFDFETLSKFLVGKKVIELGCGRGILTEKLTKICDEIIVVEGSEKNINFVKEKLNNSKVKFYHCLWEDFEYKNCDISDVVLSMGLEHLDEEAALKILNKIKNWLKPNGRLHIVVPNAYSLHRRVAYYMGMIKDVHEFSERDRLFGHKRVYDKEMLFRELKSCGYKILHWEGIFLKPLTNAMLMNLNEKVIRGFYEVGKELPDYCAHIYVVCEK